MRFTRQKKSGLLCRVPQKPSEIVLGKMMQEKVGNSYIALFRMSPLQPVEYIHLQRLDVPGERLELRLGPRAEQGLAVHQHNAQRLPTWSDAFCKPQQQGPVTCP